MRISITNIALFALVFQFGEIVGRPLSTSETKPELAPHSILNARADIAPVHIGEDAPKGGDDDTDPLTGKPGDDAGSTGSTPDDSGATTGRIGAGTGTGASDSTVLTPDQYRVRGTAANKALDDAITKGQADATVRAVGDDDRSHGTYANIDEAYDTFDDLSNPTNQLDGLSTVFEHDGIDIDSTKSMQQYITRSKPVNDKQPPEDPVNNSYYDKDDGAIVVAQAYQESDLLAVGDPKRVVNSDIIWQNWIKAAGNDGQGGLRVVIRGNVMNAGTKATVEWAHSTNDIDMDKAGEFTFSTSNPKTMNDAFTSLLGTDNIRSIVYMLKDHHNALGGKRVQKIITFPEELDEELNIAVVLG